MLRLPARFTAVTLRIAPGSIQRSWQYTGVLLIWAILAAGKRIVTSLLRLNRLARKRHFADYHRVLNQAAWSPGGHRAFSPD